MSEEAKIKTGATHRPYDEAFKRAAVAQWPEGRMARAFSSQKRAVNFQRNFQRPAGRG